MTILSGLGIVLSLVFGCLLLALIAELYYLLWWKKQRIINTSPNNTIQENYTTHAKEMFFLFCWDKPTTIINNPSSTSPIGPNPIGPNPIGPNPDRNQHDPDIEMGLGTRKDLLLKALGEESVDSDIMKLAGHPRFLFTITEETNEDLESDDGKSRSRNRSLSDLIMAIESSPPNNKLAKKSLDKYNYNNPLFESSIEAELSRLRSSPPPKFKFLRDAEEKLYRKLLEEAQKSGIFHQEGILDFSLGQHSLDEEKYTTSFFMRNGGEKKMNKEKEKEREIIHCNSQVLPLASSPSDVLSRFSVESK